MGGAGGVGGGGNGAPPSISSRGDWARGGGVARERATYLLADVFQPTYVGCYEDAGG